MERASNNLSLAKWKIYDDSEMNFRRFFIFKRDLKTIPFSFSTRNAFEHMRHARQGIERCFKIKRAF